MQGRVTGLGQKSLQKIKGYLRVSVGLAQPTYTQALQRPPLFFPGLTAKPWHDPADFEWTTALEDGYETIKDEWDLLYQKNATFVCEPKRGRGKKENVLSLMIPLNMRFGTYLLSRVLCCSLIVGILISRLLN
jgi:hypothetical protein